MLFNWLAVALSAAMVSACSHNSETRAEPESTRSETEATTPALSDLRTDMVQHIVNFEARRDSDGKIRVYILREDDGGGAYEVAGVNTRYHPEAAARLRKLVEAGKQELAEAEAVEYIARYTDRTAKQAKTNAIKFLLRDIAWNRGPTGAIKTLQIALGEQSDGKFGPKTRRALEKAERTPESLVTAITKARAKYERRVAGYRPDYERGLRNRRKNAESRARSYL